MALPLGFKSVHDERRLLKCIFGSGVGVLTVCLAFTNMTGAWEETKAFWFTGLALGAEIMLVAAFSLIILAETRARQIVGAVVFCGLAWFCVENGKAAIKHWMADVFVDAPEALRSRADLADAEAKKLDTLPSDTKTESTEQRRIDREELAALRVEYQQMLAQDEQGIKAAQTALKARGDYLGNIDGIRADLTESAMEKRGAEITARINVLQAKLDEGSAQNAAVTALAPAQTKREEAITLRTQADKAGFREVWAQILLLVAEAARSFGVWAFLMAGTRQSARFGRRAEDRAGDGADFAQAEEDLMAGLGPSDWFTPRTEDAPPQQERPAETESAAENQDQPETEETPAGPQAEEDAVADDLFDRDEDPVTARARAGGHANDLKNKAGKLDKRIPVRDWRSEEELRTAAE